MNRLATRALTAIVAMALLAGLAACGSSSGGSDSATTAASGAGDKGAITVGSKLDPEAQMLGQLMALQLEAKGYTVTTKIPTGDTDITRKALTSGKIDIYWEFTSTGLNTLK